MNIAEEILGAMRDAKAMSQASDDAGKLFATLLIVDIDKLEKVMVDSLAKYNSGDHNIPEGLVNIDKLNDRCRLLGCLVRFKHDVIENTVMGRETEKHYKEVVNSAS